MDRPKRIIAVSGCTGTGKTKLGIELAKKYNGEVISADSMQVYQGLDIITNTVTEEEADGVKHYCISYVSPDEQYNVVKYIEYTIPIIENILERGKIPIIVGGTAYYIEALLWNFTLHEFSRSGDVIGVNLSNESVQVLESSLLSDYQKLQQLDPIHAKTLHPNDSRKIGRSLEIYRTHGLCHSELIKQQHEDSCDNIRGKLRWDGALLFSMECDQQVLDKRLDDRVDKMVELGLLSELETFASEYPNSNSGLSSQVIGYKEFESYISLKRSKCTDPVLLENALSDGLDKMKTLTRRYSRKQVRWIKHRLEPNKNSEKYNFIRLDTTSPEQWEDVISKPVYEVVDKFLSGTLQKQDHSYPLPERPPKIAKHCDTCDVTCMGDDSFAVHMKSRKHRRKKAYNKSKLAISQHIADK